MTFTDHVIINDGTDTKWYKTSQRTWRSKPNNPSTARVLLSGKLDVTYGPAPLNIWDGELLVPVTSPGGSWGSVAQLRTQLARSVLYQFTDHYGTVFTEAAIQGNFDEESIMPDWDNSGNEIKVRIRVTAT